MIIINNVNLLNADIYNAFMDFKHSDATSATYETVHFERVGEDIHISKLEVEP